MSGNNNNLPASTSSFSSEEKRIGGVAWSGSLVGSENPNNLGYRYSHPHKRYKRDNEEETSLPSNMVVRFQDREGNELGDAMDIPIQSSVDDLSALVQSLLNKKDVVVPYSFYANNINDDDDDDDVVELDSTLARFVDRNVVSTEQVLVLTYHPLAVFRVRPVTRCTDTLTGHTEAVLHVSFRPDGTVLASGGGDATVRFWDVRTCTPLHVCAGYHKDHVLCTAWSPNGQRFVSSDKKGVIIVWDPKKGKPIGKPMNNKSNNNNNWITGIAWEPMQKKRRL